MTDWHDTMVERPPTEEAGYFTGWMIAALALFAAIVAVWLLGI